MTTIYYLTNLNNDLPFYIGKSVNCDSRLYSHKKTYGKNIKMVKIDLVKNKEWLFWEKHYISLFKSWGFNLLNQNNGGGGSTKATKERIEKFIKSKYKPILQYDLDGNFMKEWESAKQYVVLNGLTNGTLITFCLKGKTPTAYNSIWRYKTKRYLKKIIPNVLWINNFVSVIQYDLKGKKIKEWGSSLEASKILNIKKQNICNNLKNRSFSAGNFIWKYKE